MTHLPGRLRRWLIITVAMAVLLVGLAGRFDLPMLWAYGGVVSGLVLAAVLTLDPEVSKERLRQRAGGIDPIALALIRILALAHLVIALLDVGRFHWSDRVPLALRIAALLVFAVSLAWALWAIVSNRFFVPAVRIQTERGHHLVTDGPYGYVRHPGYLGMIIAIPASALALGSWWSLVAAAAYSLLIVRRVVYEDRFLKEKLGGYASYAERVRYRLVPGLW